MRGNQVNVKRREPDTLGGGRRGAGGGGHEKKEEETLRTAAEISRFFLPLCRIFPSNLHSYLPALAGTTKVFSTRPSGHLPATLSVAPVCLRAGPGPSTPAVCHSAGFDGVRAMQHLTRDTKGMFSSAELAMGIPFCTSTIDNCVVYRYLELSVS